MHSDLSRLLPEDLLALAAQRDAITIVAARAYRLQAVSCDAPLLVIPLQGTKSVRCGDVELGCGAGEFLLAHRALHFDVQNTPARDGPYRALALALPWRVVDLARSLLGPHAVAAPVDRASLTVGPLDAIMPPLRACLGDDGADPARADYHLLGLLLGLAQLGHTGFLGAHDASLTARVRAMLSADPARDWKAVHIEERLQMSSATLRRQLRGERTSFRAVLLDVRLHAGLALLQTSRRSVKAVAGACGYSSVPSFARAFARRFGVDPSAVAGP